MVAVAALGGIGYAVSTAERPPVLDRATLCPDTGPRAVTVVVMDGSDDIASVAKREVTTRLADVAESLPVHGLLEIRVVDPTVAGGRTIFAKCNPGNGAGLSDWTGNPELARRRWLESFRTPVDLALKGGLGAVPAKTSPIMGTIQAVAVDRFTGRMAGGIPKRLILVSDMIEHGPDYSQYNGDLTFERFRKSRLHKLTRSDLNGASVEILYVDRFTRKPINSADHVKFWLEWVRDSNGTFQGALKLQGAR
jgi:hypothetical protein